MSAKTPITKLSGVGDRTAKKLSNLGIYSVEDLLFHLPSRYQDRTRVYPIGDVYPGIHATVEAEIAHSDIKYGRARMLLVKIADSSGHLTLRFFHFSAAQQQQLTLGKRIRCFGEIRRGSMGLEINHPEYQVIAEGSAAKVEDTLTPIYPTTEGIKQLTLRKLTEQALAWLNRGELAELLPITLYGAQISLKAALNLVHRPPPDASQTALEQGKHPAQQRLIVEELLAHNLSVLKVRAQTDQCVSVSLVKSTELATQLLQLLPFALTDAQQRVIQEISADLAQQRPMMRLVQGDVGSGKTLVAAMAALSVIEAGYQTALMAPTELLAEQHANNFRQWLAPLGIEVAWLAGKLTGNARKDALAAIASGTAQMVVGTHALFQKQVEFLNLALVIVDEQHRFGVHQRLALREKGAKQGAARVFPHQLIMTATPIPRTLAMTAYADLDTSVIDQLPPGRTPVKTAVIPNSRRDAIIERVRHTCLSDNRQVYWVCTLIEESDVLQCEAAEDTWQALKAALPELAVGLVHGRMKASEKQAIMQAFKDNTLNLLVATTVIEVGVDVPNASLMIIENADRLGLAQLHQLRGRVGRGNVVSHCVLMYQAPLNKVAQQRLGVLRDSNDGFVIAQKDLEIRGPGELLGTRQTGLTELKIADLVRDADLIPQIQQWALQLWQQHPTHANAIIHRWLPRKEKYGHA